MPVDRIVHWRDEMMPDEREDEPTWLDDHDLEFLDDDEYEEFFRPDPGPGEEPGIDVAVDSAALDEPASPSAP